MPENDPKLQEFLDLVFSKPADPYGILCAFCCRPFVRRPPTGGVPVQRRICECEEGQKTKKALIDFAERRKTMYDKTTVERNFTYHPPHGDQPARYIVLRDCGKYVAEAILDKCPESPERTLALRKLEEAVMWSNAAIARNETPE